MVLKSIMNERNELHVRLAFSCNRVLAISVLGLQGSCEKINFAGTFAFRFVRNFVKMNGITFERELSFA